MQEWSADRLDRDGWDENDWEAFLRQGDVQHAKFQELADTLEGHPQRERVIAEEMGWAHVLDGCRSGQQHCAACAERDACEIQQVYRFWSAAADESSAVDDAGQDLDALHGIEAYSKGHRFCLEVHQRFDKIFDADHDPDGAVFQAVSASSSVPAKIAGGHSMGYDPDTLGGNIAYCMRALKSLDECTEALLDIRERGLAPEEQIAALLSMAEEVRVAGRGRIEELRGAAEPRGGPATTDEHPPADAG